MKLHYARNPPIGMPRNLRVLWWTSLGCAAFPYIAPVAVYLAFAVFGRGSYVDVVLIGLAVVGFGCVVVAVLLALIFTAKAETAGLPEGYVAVRRRAIGALLLGPFLLVPVVVVVFGLVALIAGLVGLD